MINAPHSGLAYLGAMLGMRTASEAARDPALRRYAEDLMRLEIAPTARGIPESGLEEYRRRFMARVSNPALSQRLQQIAMDGSQKVPQRLLGAIRDRLRRGDDCARLVLAVAAWLHYLRGHDERGDAYVVQDPLADALARLLSRADVAAAAAARRSAARAVVLAGFKPVFGDLGRKPAFVQALAVQLERLREQGVRAAWRNWSGNRPDASWLASLDSRQSAMKRRLALYVVATLPMRLPAWEAGRRRSGALASVVRHRGRGHFHLVLEDSLKQACGIGAPLLGHCVGQLFQHGPSHCVSGIRASNQASSVSFPPRAIARERRRRAVVSRAGPRI